MVSDLKDVQAKIEYSGKRGEVRTHVHTWAHIYTVYLTCARAQDNAHQLLVRIRDSVVEDFAGSSTTNFAGDQRTVKTVLLGVLPLRAFEGSLSSGVN